MTTKISPRDWEALSAYLDGQLPPKERTRLEKSLQTSADLRAALEELRRTHVILRSQAAMRAPRNFTLTAEMAGIKKARPASRSLFPTFRLATVLATALFVLVLAGDFLTAGQEPVVFQLASRSAQPNQQLLAAPQAPAPQEKLAGAYPAPTEAPAAAAAPQATGLPPAVEAPAATEAPVTAVPELAGAAPQQPTATPSTLQLQAGAQAYPSPGTAPSTALRSSKVVTGTQPAALSPMPTAGLQADNLAAGSTLASGAVTAAAPTTSWAAWRVLELVFAALALVMGILAFSVWRAGRL